MKVIAESAGAGRPAAPRGISVVICSYNGAPRLPAVLVHLARQDAGGDIPWEVIVVDNASTDDTAKTARRCWPQGQVVPLRVVSEPRLGLAFAKRCGIIQARYEFVAFVDDDSRVCPGWVRAAAQACLQHPEAGAVRGVIEAECESVAPRWFKAQQGWFGIWPDIAQACDVTEVAGGLCGDGMVLRKSAWEDLRNRGFDFTLTGNQGTDFNGSEDEELSLALRLAGWRFWYDPRLRLRQFLPRDKLRWDNLRRRARNAGISSVGLDPYYAVLRKLDGGGKSTLVTMVDGLPAQWLWRALWSFKDVARRPITVLLMRFFGLEGREEVLAAEVALSRFRRLLYMRSSYDVRLRQTQEIRWRE